MSKKVEVNNNGIGFVGLLTIVLIVMKLTGTTAMSWWWVFSPIWITAILVFAALLFLVLLEGK